jgi:hypothetical protein
VTYRTPPRKARNLPNLYNKSSQYSKTFQTLPVIINGSDFNRAGKQRHQLVPQVSDAATRRCLRAQTGYPVQSFICWVTTCQSSARFDRGGATEPLVKAKKIPQLCTSRQCSKIVNVADPLVAVPSRPERQPPIYQRHKTWRPGLDPLKRSFISRQKSTNGDLRYRRMWSAVTRRRTGAIFCFSTAQLSAQLMVATLEMRLIYLYFLNPKASKLIKLSILQTAL